MLNLIIEKATKTNFTVNVTTAEGNASVTMNNEQHFAYYNVNAVIKYKGIPIDTIEGVFYTERLDDEYINMIHDEQCDRHIVYDLVSNALYEMMQTKLDFGFSLDEIFGDQVMFLYMKTIYNRLYHIVNQHSITFEKLLEKFQRLYCVLYRHGYEYRLMFHHNNNKLCQNIMKLHGYNYK